MASLNEQLLSRGVSLREIQIDMHEGRTELTLAAIQELIDKVCMLPTCEYVYPVQWGISAVQSSHLCAPNSDSCPGQQENMHVYTHANLSY